MNKVIIKMDSFNSIKEFHVWLKEECAFPEYYGCNLDALFDCLTENNHFEFEVFPSLQYESYQMKLVDTMIDAGCKVYFVFED